MLVAFLVAACFISPQARAQSQLAEDAILPYIHDVLPENIADFNLGADGGLIVKELRRGSSHIKEVALTFDDGPHPAYTAQLLSILRYYRVPATFFLVGVQAERYPKWVRMIHQEGHEIGCHTYDHFRLVNLPLDEQVYQIEEFTSLIYRLTGTQPNFLRPPGGQYDHFTISLMNKNRMALGLWTINTNDTAPQTDAASLYQRVIGEVGPGSIILMHDGADASLVALPRMIETLKRRGYSFVTMSQMMARANSEVMNGSNRQNSGPGAENGGDSTGQWKIISY